jgi:hypothetical protein
MTARGDEVRSVWPWPARRDRLPSPLNGERDRRVRGGLTPARQLHREPIETDATRKLTPHPGPLPVEGRGRPGGATSPVNP